MINVVLTVAEVVSLIRSTDSEHLLSRLTLALEAASKPVSVEVTITGFSQATGMIPTIKVLRKWFGWSLREAKAFCDEIRGEWMNGGDSYPNIGNWGNGKPKSVSIAGEHDAARFMAELGAAGAFFSVK
jgi:hypothetical protein